MVKKDLPHIDNLREEVQEFYFVLVEEKSDLAVVLISTSFIEDCLTVGLRNHLKKSTELTERKLDNLFDDNFGLLSTLADKILMAYCMSIIDKNVYDNLDQIRKIRNKFAHSRLNISFGDEEISPMCKKLDYCQKPTPGIKDKDDENPLIKLGKTPRLKFVITVVLITQKLLISQK